MVDSKEIEGIIKAYNTLVKGIHQKATDDQNRAQGLSPYQAIQWANHREQQKDFDLLNEYILETAYDENALLNFINNNKEKWAVFYKTKITNSVEVKQDGI